MLPPCVTGGAPFVQSLLFCIGYWILDCKPPHCSPILFGVVLWLCGAFHWMLVQFASVRYSFDVATYYLCTSLVGGGSLMTSNRPSLYSPLFRVSARASTLTVSYAAHPIAISVRVLVIN